MTYGRRTTQFNRKSQYYDLSNHLTRHATSTCHPLSSSLASDIFCFVGMKLFVISFCFFVFIGLSSTATVGRGTLNIPSQIADNKHVCVYFTEDSTYEPGFNKVINAVTGKDDVVFLIYAVKNRVYQDTLGKVDGEVEEFIWYTNGVRKSIYGLTQGKHFLPDSLNEWIEHNYDVNSLETVNSKQAFDDITSDCDGETSTIVLFTTDSNTKAEQTLLSLYFQLDSIFRFIAVRDRKLIKEIGAEDNSVSVYQCYEETLTKTFTRKLNDFPKDEPLAKWVLRRSAPLVSQASTAAFSKGNECFDLNIVVSFPDDADKQSLIDAMTTLAKGKKDLGFIYGTSMELLPYLFTNGVYGRVFPTVALLGKGRQRVNIYWNEDTPMNKNTLTQWVNDIYAGKAVSYVKSAPQPAKSKTNVQVVVADTFTEEVLKSKTPVIVFFNSASPKCTVCHQAKSDFGHLTSKAKTFYKFATYNVDENYLPSVPGLTVPAVVIFTDGRPNFNFNAHTPEDLRNWIKEIVGEPKDEL